MIEVEYPGKVTKTIKIHMPEPDGECIGVFSAKGTKTFYKFLASKGKSAPQKETQS